MDMLEKESRIILATKLGDAPNQPFMGTLK
jgi:hypothetical protein